MITWTTVEAALQAWAVAGTGLGTGSVIHAGQAGPRVAAPFVTIERISLTGNGMDAIVVRAAAVPAPGAEIEIAAVGERVATFKIAAYAGPGGTPVGNSSPGALLERMRSMAWLPGRIEAFHAAGLGLSNVDTVNEIKGQFGGILEPQAWMTARFHLSSEVVETATYIESVEVTDLINGDEFIVSA